MNKILNIGMVGTRFMGKAHSNAFRTAPAFFDLPCTPILHTLCGRDTMQLQHLARRFGWKHQQQEWEQVIENKEVDIVDVCVPNYLHAPVALAAAKAGKHVLCENPSPGMRRKHG